MPDDHITEELRAILAPASEPADEPPVSTLEELLNSLGVVPRNRRGLLKIHYRHPDQADTTACGKRVEPSRVTADGTKVECKRCRKSIPPTPAEAAALLARLDDDHEGATTPWVNKCSGATPTPQPLDGHGLAT